MSLLDRAREEMQRFTSDSDGFSTEAVFTAPDGTTATINAIHTKHKEEYMDEDSVKTITIASIAVSEELLKNEGYPTRNASGLVHFESHRVDVTDSTGNVKNYIVDKWFPDEMLGLIVLIMKAYE